MFFLPARYLIKDLIINQLVLLLMLTLKLKKQEKNWIFLEYE